ncbi:MULTISPECIES: hypothetical protein [unclassified Microbacterium]|uniref:hypothetical protein n=1 Tax=unclassified Microbacterium TaxID=2609290 RepID=UPI0030194BF6
MSIHVRKTLFATVAALAVAGGLAGCQSSPASDSASTGLDIDPLAVVSGYTGNSDEVTKQQDQIITQCMQEQGFTYTPIDYTSDGTSAASSWLSPSRETVTEHGYGIVENYVDFAADKPAPDANTDYYNGLSPAEQTAYDTALLGDFATEGSNERQSWEDQGCTGKAEHSIAEAKLNPPAIIQQASDYRNTLGNDAKITAILNDWGTCMSDAGYPDEPRWGFGGTLDSKVGTFFADHPDAPATDPAVVKLKAEEVTVALADLDCAEKVDFDRRYVDTMTALEKDFVNDHKAELDEAHIWAQQNLGAE